MSTLSYQEKSLYGAFAVDLAVFIPYFVLIHTSQLTLNFIVGGVFLLTAAHIAIQIGIAIASRNRMTDERDRLIELRGYRAGYFSIISLMILGLGILWVYSWQSDFHPQHMALHFISVFFAMLMLSEIVKTATQLVAYRRSI
jgi:hypothetical protein